MRYEFRSAEACNMCGSLHREVFGMRLNRSQGLRPKRVGGIAVSIERCRDCGLLFANPLPVPEKMSDHYGIPPEDYWAAEVKGWEPSYFAREIATAKRHIDFRPGMRALDIGAGLGKCMKSLEAAGFDASGIEPTDVFRNRAISMMGVAPERVQLATLEEAEFPAASFDFITFGAVLEHLFDPDASLRKALGWLRPGGVIQAEVPNADYLVAKLVNLFFRLRGTNYVTNLNPMHPPFHLYEFTLDSFRRNGSRTGYEIAEHQFMVCSIFHVPRLLHPPLRWWMDRHDSGMQLTVWLRPVQR